LELIMRRLVPVLMVLLWASIASAAPMTLYQAPDNTYANTANNPCLFFGPGGSGCNQDPANWPAALPVGDTGGGNPFNPNPLTYSFVGADLLAFAQDVGGSFLLALDINDRGGGPAQTLSNVTVNFFNAANVNIGSYTFGPPLLTVPSVSNGVGFADYILAPGCTGTTAGSGNTTTCTQYTPFTAPSTGVRRIDFTFGETGFNAGGDKLFLIGTPGVSTFCVDATCDVAAVPEPASMMLMGTGLLGLVRMVRKRKS
jgi:hypothetical protein